MPGANRRIFISHAHADNERCGPLLAALDAWGVDYWFDLQELNPGQELTDRLQQAIAERDVFIRVCTPACQQSYWTQQEMLAFRGLQQQQGQGRRKLIYLILDAGYAPEPVVEGDVVINAVTRKQAEWMGDLRQTLGVTQAARAMNRRAFLGLGVAGVATVASVGTAAAVLIRGREASGGTTDKLVPSAHQPTPTPLANTERIVWYQQFSDGGGQLDATPPGVAVGGGVVYAASKLGIYALNGQDGSLVWRTDKVTTWSGGSIPTLASAKLYLLGTPQSLSLTGALYCLSTADGSRLWVTDFPQSQASRLTVTADGLFCSAPDGNLYAFDPATGAKKWATTIGGSHVGSSAPAVANGRVFVGSDNDTMQALDAATGQPLWTHQVGTQEDISREIRSSPLVLNDTVYFGGPDGNVYALNAADGSVKWTYNAGKYHEFSMSPVIDNGVLYIAEEVERAFIALDAATGAVRWQQAYSISGGSHVTLGPSGGRVAVSQSAVYWTVGDSAVGFYLLAADKSTGNELWRVALPQGGINGMTEPILAGGVVYFGGADGAVYAVSAA